MARLVLGFFMAAVAAWAEPPKRLLYVTHSAGFVHGSIGVSKDVLAAVGVRAGVEVTATEDLSYFDAGRLDGFDAVFFFTSGELPLSEARKQNLLAFVRGGKGFGGVHSATDTLYQWAEYGELIGAYFNAHPWTQEATVEIEDPDHPATSGLGTSFRLREEFYIFRSFSRDRVRVLLTLDPESVGQADGDFPLAWVRSYDEGRVFYTALGHFDETWMDRRFQAMLEGALRYLTGQVEADASPRRSRPLVTTVSNLAHETSGVVAPGLLVAIEGTGLTSGSSLNADALPLPFRLAGAQVRVNGARAPLISVSPERIVAMIPAGVKPGETVTIESISARVDASSPGILGVVRSGQVLSIYATGLALPDVEVLANGRALTLDFAGAAPGLAGMQQVNARLPDDLPASFVVRLRSAGRESNAYQQAAQ